MQKHEWKLILSLLATFRFDGWSCIIANLIGPSCFSEKCQRGFKPYGFCDVQIERFFLWKFSENSKWLNKFNSLKCSSNRGIYFQESFIMIFVSGLSPKYNKFDKWISGSFELRNPQMINEFRNAFAGENYDIKISQHFIEMTHETRSS